MRIVLRRTLVRTSLTLLVTSLIWVVGTRVLASAMTPEGAEWTLVAILAIVLGVGACHLILSGVQARLPWWPTLLEYLSSAAISGSALELAVSGTEGSGFLVLLSVVVGVPSALVGRFIRVWRDKFEAYNGVERSAR